MRTIAAIAVVVTETPWTLTPAVRAAAATAGIDDDALVHVVALSAFFGHLNRVADATGVPLDYAVRYPAPHAEPATPPLARAPHVVAPVAGSLSLARRPATAEALAAWQGYLMERDAPLPRATRLAIAAQVAGRVGAAPSSEVDDPRVRDLVDTVTLAPWALGAAAYAPLRATGADDAYLFDVCVVASTAGVQARIAVALAALGAAQ